MDNQVIDDNIIGADNIQTKFAGFGIRLGASLIDFGVLLPFSGLAMYNVYVLKNFPLSLIIGLIALCYKPFMEYQYGATLGKMAVKIKVVNEKFERITLSQSLIRFIPWMGTQLLSLIVTYLLFQNPEFQNATGFMQVALLQGEIVPSWINLAVSSITIISCIMVAFTKHFQGLHDMMADTYCVYKNQYD